MCAWNQAFSCSLCACRGAAGDLPRRRLDPSGSGGHDPDPVVGVLPGERRGERVDPALGRRVRDAVDAARGRRRDVDDRAAALFDHERQHRPAAPHRREQRPPDLRLDLRLGELDVRLEVDRAADVVDQDVDRGRSGCGPRPSRSRRPGTAPGPRRARWSARPRSPSFSATSYTSSRAVHQGDRAPFPGRPGGHRLPEALRRAGDDQDLAVEPTGESSQLNLPASRSRPASSPSRGRCARR